MHYAKIRIVPDLPADHLVTETATPAIDPVRGDPAAHREIAIEIVNVIVIAHVGKRAPLAIEVFPVLHITHCLFCCEVLNVFFTI